MGPLVCSSLSVHGQSPAVSSYRGFKWVHGQWRQKHIVDNGGAPSWVGRPVLLGPTGVLTACHFSERSHEGLGGDVSRIAHWLCALKRFLVEAQIKHDKFFRLLHFFCPWTAYHVFAVCG